MKNKIAKLRAVAEHLKGTKVPVKEITVIERILGSVKVLEEIANEMEAEESRNEADHQ